MTEDVVKEFAHMQQKLNSAVQRLDSLNNVQHLDNADQISDLQELMIDSIYDETLSDLGLEDL